MKRFFLYSLAFLALTLGACKKDIPSDRLGFIGTWECISCGIDEIKTIVVKANGTGSYQSILPGRQFGIAGHVRFDGSIMKIGGAIFKKKLKINSAPFKHVLSKVPYTYEWTAKIDDEEYLKTEE